VILTVPDSQQSGELVPRGRKLVLQYTGGSPCSSSDKEKDKRAAVHEEARYKSYDVNDGKEEEHQSRRSPKNDDDDDKSKEKEKEKKKQRRRKSATISFLCDHDPDTPTAASFVGTDPDECAYFFEVRSQHACAGAEPHKKGSVGPGSVFAIIFFIAVLVYVMGGVFYQRTVAHARGWRQLPNYSLWAGIWSFVKVGGRVVRGVGYCLSLTLPPPAAGPTHDPDFVVRPVYPETERIPHAVGFA
jgi:cation-dependent mannose-6-phosphate receptor